jgi:hypothetical protein
LILPGAEGGGGGAVATGSTCDRGNGGGAGGIWEVGGITEVGAVNGAGEVVLIGTGSTVEAGYRGTCSWGFRLAEVEAGAGGGKNFTGGTAGVKWTKTLVSGAWRRTRTMCKWCQQGVSSKLF